MLYPTGGNQIDVCSTPNERFARSPAIPKWPSHVALATPLFFDIYSAQTLNEAWNTRMAKEKKAINFGKQGFSHCKHIVKDNSIISQAEFMKLPSNMNRPKLTGFNDMVTQIPAPALKGLRSSNQPSEIEWVQLPTKQIAKVEQIIGEKIKCCPQQLCPKTGALSDLGVRPLTINIDLITPCLVQLTEKKDKSSAINPILICEDLKKANYPTTEVGVAWKLTMKRTPPLTYRPIDSKRSQEKLCNAKVDPPSDDD